MNEEYWEILQKKMMQEAEREEKWTNFIKWNSIFEKKKKESIVIIIIAACVDFVLKSSNSL